MRRPQFADTPGPGLVRRMNLTFTTSLRDITGGSGPTERLSERLELDIEGVENLGVPGSLSSMRYGISPNPATITGPGLVMFALSSFAERHPEIDMDKIARTADSIIAQDFAAWNTHRPQPLLMQENRVMTRFIEGGPASRALVMPR